MKHEIQKGRARDVTMKCHIVFKGITNRKIQAKSTHLNISLSFSFSFSHYYFFFSVFVTNTHVSELGYAISTVAFVLGRTMSNTQTGKTYIVEEDNNNNIKLVFGVENFMRDVMYLWCARCVFFNEITFS